MSDVEGKFKEEAPLKQIGVIASNGESEENALLFGNAFSSLSPFDAITPICFNGASSLNLPSTSDDLKVLNKDANQTVQQSVFKSSDVEGKFKEEAPLKQIGVIASNGVFI
jgi:hypothetical protein